MTAKTRAGADPEPEKAERGWAHFDHDADIGVRGFGPDPAAAFEEAAIALTATMTDPEMVVPRTCVKIACAATDLEFLLVEWLNALVYEMATRHLLFSRFAIAIRGTKLRAEAWGEPVDPARHEPATEVKGATLTALEVAPRPEGGWRAQCVVDV